METVQLASAGYTLDLAPAAGACVLSLTFNGVPLLRSAPRCLASPPDPRDTACFPCTPWFGRVRGNLKVRNRRASLLPTLRACDPENALHGHGWVSPWRIDEAGADHVQLIHDHTPAPGLWPSAHRTTMQCFVSARGVQITLTIRNTDRQSAPVGLGLHPFFPRNVETRLRFNARRLWTPPGLGERTGESDIPAAFDFHRSQHLPDTTIDHSYLGFGGVVEIDGGDFPIKLASNAPHLHLFAPENEAFYSLEPITQMPGVFDDSGTDPSLELAPGAERELSLSIAVMR